MPKEAHESGVRRALLVPLIMRGCIVILLHGFPEFWWAWRHQITPLAEHGFHVVAPDTRGYNLSEAPQEISAYRLPTLVADVVALANGFGADRFRLVGHDWGGVVAWGVGTSHPNRIDRLVVMNAPHPDLWTSEALRHPTQALRSSYVALFQLPWLPEAVLKALNFGVLRKLVQSSARSDTFKPGELDQYQAAWSRPGALTAMLNYYRALREHRPSHPPARIPAPTLVLWGEDDRFLELHLAKDTLKLCDHGRLSTVKGATHWLHLEEPDRVNSELLAFVA
jgi:epoxide hydrolase 4